MKIRLAHLRAASSVGLVLISAITFVATALHAQQPPPAPTPTPVSPDQPLNRQGRQVSLYDQLRVGLKAKTKADLAFIDLVVLRVNQGVLPRKMVDATFLWARNRYKSRPDSSRLRPIVYFQPALTLQAKKIGVVL
jgi:hypothetical protein